MEAKRHKIVVLDASTGEIILGVIHGNGNEEIEEAASAFKQFVGADSDSAWMVYFDIKDIHGMEKRVKAGAVWPMRQKRTRAIRA